MLRNMYIFFTLTLFVSCITDQVSAQDEDDDEEDGDENDVKKTVIVKPTVKSGVANAKQVPTNVKTQKSATTTKTTLKNTPLTTAKTPLMFKNVAAVAVTITTTSDPRATLTYSYEEEKQGSCRPSCLPYKCSVDSTLMFINGTRKVTASIGRIKFVCKKYHIFSVMRVNWTTAHEICCAFNMRLLNIESYDQYQCIRNLFFDSQVHASPGGQSYWVSGSDEECERRYGWCEIDRPFATWIYWAGGENSESVPVENCALINYGLYVTRKNSYSQFMDGNCAGNEKFICEEYIAEPDFIDKNPAPKKSKWTAEKSSKRGECKRPKCLPYKCSIDANFVETNGTIGIPQRIGTMKTVCGRNDLFSKIKVPWIQARETCCSLNMQLINFKTEDQFQCFKSLGVSSGVHNVLGANFYWTAGSDEGCNGKFMWCDTRELFQNWDSWPKSGPGGDPNKNCVIFSYVISPLAKAHDFNMYDIPCNDTNNFFICEESPKDNSALIKQLAESKLMFQLAEMKRKAIDDKFKVVRKYKNNAPKYNGWNISEGTARKSGCLYPRCLHYNCVIDPQLLEEGANLKDAPDIGVTKSICGKKFLFSKIEKTWTEAQELCCSLDMRLYNVESAEQMTCIRDLNIESGLHYHMGVVSYWTGGSDQGCEAKFGWCNSRQMLEKWIAWAKGAPKNANGNENCLALDYVVHFSKSEQASNFTDANCELKKKFICEELTSSLTTN